MSNFRSYELRSTIRAALGMATLGLGTLSAAQVVAANAVSGTAVEEVVVAASRVARSGYTAPTPTTILGADDIDRQGAANVSEILNEIPSFKATTGPQTNGILARTPGATYSDLRGLGASRTLVLVDGKRFVPQIATALAGYQVDLNQVPTLMVERAEVVTGGASAQWGSDAVAGVVNLVLKKNFEGIRAEVQTGQSKHGDNESERFALLAGTNFAEGRGNITVAGDYYNNDGVGEISTRSWGRKNYSLVANPVRGNGPANYILPDVQFANYTPGGLINNTILRGIQFDASGQPIPFEYGEMAGTLNMVGGGQPGVNIAKNPWIAPAVERFSTYGRLSYDFNDSVTGYFEASFAETTGGGLTLPARDTAIVIRQDNAYLPDSIRQVMIDNSIDSFNLGRISYDFSSARSKVVNETARVVAGLEGDLDVAGGWSWDAHYLYGENDYHQQVFNNRIHANFRLAYDAVQDPTTGAIVCRSTLTNPGNGCYPLNVFGVGNASQQAIDYVTGTTDATTVYKQHAAAFNVSGEPFSTWAGSVSVAAGLEYRSEEQLTRVDPIAIAAGYESSNSQPIHGKFNVKEVYLETVVPVLSGDQSLDLNGAVRYADYSTAAGGQTTWKLGLTYQPADSLMIRAVRSRDIRAPNIYELNIGPTSLINVISYPPFQPQVFQISTGNPNLQPEVADTTTFGFSYNPDWLPELQMSLDYYRIEAEDIVGTLPVQQIANYCLEGQASYCSLITFDDTGMPTHVQLPYMNLATVELSGIDASLTYRPVFDSIPGNFTFNISGNYALKAEVNATGTMAIDRVGETGPGNAYSTARFRGTANLVYDLDAFSIGAQVRHVSSGKYNATWTTGVQINDNTLPSVTYLDLNGSYNVTEALQIFAVIDNVLDKDPPPAPVAQGAVTNPVYFDMIGTTFRIGARLSF